MAEAPETDISAAIISSAAPDTTTASLAADVPIEHSTISSVAPEFSTATQAVSTPDPSDVPGGFPKTPAAEIAEPTPIAGEGQVFSVKPLPASDTPTNPFHLEPGEPIPHNEFTATDINRHVKLDEASYNRADASNLGFSPNGAPVLPEVVTPNVVREAEGRGVLDIPEVTANMIPESSLPITSFAVATAVKENQKTDVEPEALVVPEIVEPKEETLTTSGDDQKPQTVGGIMAAAGIASASGELKDEATSTVVPEIVRDSQKEAHFGPEASAVEEAVEAKREFEEEIKREVHQLTPVTLNAESGTAPEATGTTEAVELKKELTEQTKPTEPLEAETLAVPSKTENGTTLNGNGTSTKSDKSEKEIEANGNGTKSPKKSFENGDAGELKKSKRKSFFGSIKDRLFHTGTGAKDKGKAKGEISP